MQRIIGVTELQRRFRSIFDEVTKKNIPYVLTRGSRPEAALIPYEEFLQFQALKEQEVLSNFDRLTARLSQQNTDIDEAELIADIKAARTALEGSTGENQK